MDGVTPEEVEAAEVDEEADVNEAAEVECETAVDEEAEVEVEHFEVPTSSSPFQMASISPTEVKSTDVIEVPPLPVMPEQEPAEEVEETVTEQEEDDGLGEGVDESDEDDGFYFEVPLGTVVERLDAFAGWAQRRLGDGELMLVDDHGDLLWGAQARAGVVLSTLLATRAMSRSSAAAACHTPLVHTQPTGSDLLLSVVSCPTRVGVLHLAVLQAEALDEDEATLLKQALQSSIDVTG